MLVPSLGLCTCEVDVNLMPRLGICFLIPFPLQLCGQGGQGSLRSPCPRPLCHTGRRLTRAHHLGLLCLKLSGAPARLGQPSSPHPHPGPREPSGPLEGLPPKVPGQPRNGPAPPSGLHSRGDPSHPLPFLCRPCQLEPCGTCGVWPQSCSRCPSPEAPEPGDLALGPVLTQLPSWWASGVPHSPCHGSSTGGWGVEGKQPPWEL